MKCSGHGNALEIIYIYIYCLLFDDDDLMFMVVVRMDDDDDVLYKSNFAQTHLCKH